MIPGDVWYMNGRKEPIEKGIPYLVFDFDDFSEQMMDSGESNQID